MAKKVDQDEHEKYTREMAIRTRNWARRIGAFIDLDEPEEKNHGYFTVEEWAEEFEQSKRAWSEIKQKIVALGEPLAVGMAGHYWGKPGAQGINPVRLIVQAMSLMESATRMITAMQSTKDWESCKLILEDGLSDSRHEMTLENLVSFANGAGYKLPEAVQKSLQAPKPSE